MSLPTTYQTSWSLTNLIISQKKVKLTKRDYYKYDEQNLLTLNQLVGSRFSLIVMT